ncbi:uncharacterized protein N7498_007889 [Penicillium cinerascens]|uniref:Uncharacterized protein n=1 Tax=Penicillium cinerascens TaxID=70096 RepID=A0A9W9MFN4_9EURO|nr:uncharacterized protein N7498_007889 [Penicillium cinerascens]KAJ5198772.1 hypothetical protein N7498_007889 [Penicillium cinerascens]
MTTAQIISPRYAEHHASEMEITGSIKKVPLSTGGETQKHVSVFCDAGLKKATRWFSEKIQEAIGDVGFLLRQGPVIVLSIENHSEWGIRLAHPSRNGVSIFRDLSDTEETRVTFKLYPQDLPKETTLETRPVVRKLLPDEILFVKGSVRFKIEIPSGGFFVWQGNSHHIIGSDIHGSEIFEFMAI